MLALGGLCIRYLGAFSPPVIRMTEMIISPVVNKRTPALTPKVLSMVKSRTWNNSRSTTLADLLDAGTRLEPRREDF
jgi:hypothetical protein